MDLRRIEAFTAVATELHFGRAAERLHIAPSALSQQIRRLEDELGVVLLHRTTRRVELTPAGHALLRHARPLLDAVGEAARSAQLAQAGEEGHLTVGFAGSTTYELMPKVVRAFRERHPKVGLSLRGEQVTADQVAGLMAGEIDVGFLRPPVDVPQLVVEALRTEPLVVALPEGHELLEREAVGVADLATSPFVTYPAAAGASTLITVMRACIDAGFTPEVVQEAKESHALISLVAAGFGVALVPEALSHLRMPGVAYRPLAPPVPEVALSIAWRRADASKLVEHFVAVAREVVG